MNLKILSVFLLLMGSSIFAKAQAIIDHSLVAGDWIDKNRGADTWGAISLGYGVGDIADTTFKMNGDTLIMGGYLDMKHPVRGKKWQAAGVVVKATTDSLVIFNPEFKNTVRFYNAYTKADKTVKPTKISLSGDNWFGEHSKVKIEINSDGSYFLQGIGKADKKNYEGHISPATFAYYEKKLQQATPDKLEKYYQCGCVSALQWRMVFAYNGKQTQEWVYGYDEAPPALQLIISSIIVSSVQMKLVPVTAEHEFVSFDF